LWVSEYVYPTVHLITQFSKTSDGSRGSYLMELVSEVTPTVFEYETHNTN
jgi:hypothetical protein